MKPILLAITVIASATFLQAASVITVNNGTAGNNSAATSLTLPSGAGTDWGYFNQSGTPASPSSSYNANNTSFTGGRLFTVTTLGGGNVRGPGTASTGSAEAFYDFDNGTTPGTGTDVRPTGVFNTQLGATGVTNSAGLSMVLSGFTGPSVVQLWTFGFQATGQFTVFLNGISQYTTSISSTAVTNGKPTTLFNLTVTPDDTDDEIEVRYVSTASADDFSHIGFQAVAISPVPEPASLTLLSLAGVGLGFRRRRSGK